MIRLLMLGQPLICGSAGPVPIPAKAMGLLAYLALHPEPQPRERMIELLWPDRSPLSGRKLLRNLLWQLRHDVCAGVVGSERDHLVLGRAVWVDVGEFAKTSQLALYRGNLLDGLEVQDAPEFETWLLAERERWRSALIKILERAIAEQKAIGRWDEVESLARRGLIHDPLADVLNQLLMEAMAYLGRRADAIHQYELWRERWRDQMALEPSKDTQILYQAIVADEVPVSPLTPSTPLPAATVEPDRARDLLLLQAGSLGLGRVTMSPYDTVLTPLQHLGHGWQMAWSGDAPEALAAFEAAVGGFMSSNETRAAAQAFCELASLALASRQYDVMSRWMRKCSSLAQSSCDPALQRLQQCLLGLVEVQNSGDAALTILAVAFTKQVVPELLAASRCELAHKLAARGLLDDVAHDAVERLALRRR